VKRTLTEDSSGISPSRRSGTLGLPNALCEIGVIILEMWRTAAALLGLTVSVLAMAMPMATAAASEAPQPIKVRVHLEQDRVVAGQPIKGSVVFTNTTRKAITVDQCATDGWLAVGLSGRVDSHPFGHFLVGCPPSVRLHPGPNRFQVHVITTYASCVQPQPDGSSSPTPLDPWCSVAGPPPLPAGRYVTKVDVVGLTGLTQAPNRIVIHLSSPKNPPRLAPCADVAGAPLPTVAVPNVVGMESGVAAAVLAKLCLNAGYASPVANSVMSEVPTAGSKVAEHSTVTLTTR
jgi:PASTA domain